MSKENDPKEALAGLDPDIREQIERQQYLRSLPRPTPTQRPKAREDEAIVAQDVCRV